MARQDGPRTIDYYFSLASPWAYLGHAQLMDIASRFGVRVHFKPVYLVNVFAQTGGLTLPNRHPARQRYRLLELQRWRERRGLDFHVRPKFWPFDVNLADRMAIAAAQAGSGDAFLRQAFAGVWERELNLADPQVLTRLANHAGLDGAGLLAVAQADATEATYERHFEEAVAADVFGSPAYVLDGEVFWGQDRLDLLDDALTSGRPPFTPLV
jgi:2-hydroxychromene-2-carboxylate isomerase